MLNLEDACSYLDKSNPTFADLCALVLTVTFPKGDFAMVGPPV